MADSHEDWLPGGRYRLDQRVGIGRLTEAWTGYDTRLDREVFVRVVRSDLASDADLVTRLGARLREASRLELAGLARIYDMIEGDVVAVVTEPPVGPDLRQRLTSGGPLPSAEATTIASETAKTIDEIHRRGSTHGGLTAASLAWASDDRLMITDLGTGGDADAGADETVQGDIVALASIVHEMVTGRPPHHAGVGLELDPSVPVELVGPLHDALTDNGFSSAGAFVEALGRTRSFQAEPTSFAQAERRWLVPTGIVVGIGMLLAVIGSLLGRTDAGRTIIEGARGAVGLETPETTTSTTQPSLPLITTTTVALAPVSIVQIVDFDPEGDDKSESPRRLSLINDGDPARGWQTERYNTAEFGNLKSGVGLLIDVQPVEQFVEIIVRSPSRGWSMELYVADDPSGVVADWGSPVAEVTDVRADVVFEDIDQGGRSLLLWFTRLGEGSEHRVVVTDIEISGLLSEVS